MLFNSPLSSSKADTLVGLLNLRSGHRVLDVGCGTGEFLARVVASFKAGGVGIDINSTSLETARENAASRSLSDQLEFKKADIQDFKPANLFDCALCIGSTHAFSLGEPAFPEAIKGLTKMVKPGGSILIGEGFWMQDPAREYLEFLGDPAGVYRTHEENIGIAQSLGLLPLYATTSNLDEWDDFEWRHYMKIETMASENPTEENLQRRDRGRIWRTNYLKWGRGTMGFGFYLFRKETSQ